MAINKVLFTQKDGECYATIKQSTAERTTIYIDSGKDGSVSYPKVITEAEQTINLTPYLRADMEVKPFVRGNITDTTMCAMPIITTEDGRTYTSEVVYTYAIDRNVLNDHLCSDLPYRLIEQGQFDVLTAQVMGFGHIDTSAGTEEENEEHYVTDLAITHIPTADVKLTTWDDMGSPVIVSDIRYVFRNMGLNGVRLAWVNRYGALDFWNFDHLREENVAVQVEKIYTKDGYTPIAMQKEKQITISTKELPKAALEALSYILASPAVWLVTTPLNTPPQSSDFVPIDILTDSCRVYSDAELSALEITYRAKQRERW